MQVLKDTSYWISVEHVLEKADEAIRSLNGEKFYAACTETTVNANLCRGTAITTIPTYWLGMLCKLYTSGDISKDTFIKQKNTILTELAFEFKGYERELINAGVKVAKKSNQDCPI